ncbi:MAG TPA: hypothetical protein VGP93_05500 [Polyangiaceae bacterium]|jgi:hypothetical protein|nr:hypothetical protein [Polyangiaceae bacterium]
MSASGSWLRALSLGLTFSVLTLGVLTARAVLEGQAELALSKSAFDRGQLGEAVLHARRAATAYAPSAPHVDAAYARLRSIALGSEAAGDAQTARLAWGAIRSAALESRHVLSPHEADRQEADRQLLRLSSEGAPKKTAPTAKLALDERNGPRPGWAALLVLGFGLALGGLGFIALRGVASDGRIQTRPALLGLLLGLAGAACWTLSLYWA